MTDVWQRLWHYCCYGGHDNFEHLLRYAGHLLGLSFSYQEPQVMPRAGIFLAGEGQLVDYQQWVRHQTKWHPAWSKRPQGS